MEVVVVTRHAGFLRWLQAHHPQLVNGAEVLPHVTAAEQIRGRTVVGNLPLGLAAEAKMVLAPTYEVPAELRGQELTAEQLEQLGCHLEAFQVVKHKIELEELGPDGFCDWYAKEFGVPVETAVADNDGACR